MIVSISHPPLPHELEIIIIYIYLHLKIIRMLKKRNGIKERRLIKCREEDSERVGAGGEDRWVSAEVTAQVPP